MLKEKTANKLLIQRNEHWYYQRRVPRKYSHIDPRNMVKKSLETRSIDVARMRRDALVEADNEYWLTLALEAVENGGVSDTTLNIEQQRYKASSLRALAYGYRYKPAERLAREESSEELLERVEKLIGQSSGNKVAHVAEVDALLGGTAEPSRLPTKVSKAFALYIKDIAFDDQYNKSPRQKYSWEKTKRTSISYFINLTGDIDMEAITRQHVITYRNWWKKRMIASPENPKPAKPNTANRHIGNMRTLYAAFFKYYGDENRQNPFRNVFFKGETKSSVAPFEDKWVQEKILQPGLFNDLRLELRVMIYVLTETGARMSEICNLMPEDIRLNETVPYIAIQSRQNRELKTPDSEREIPLVGVALEAMKLCPNGFEHYRDKGELVSANLMKAFRTRDLLPTPNHVIYSLRHSFEKRMLEAGLDYALRCTLMGHKNDRPAYGDGGSMEYRRDEMLKIVHPFSATLSDW